MMKFNKLKCVALMSAAVLSGVAAAADYRIDPMHTNARFVLDHFDTSSNVGGFFNLAGKVSYDAQKKTGFVDIAIPLANLDTGRLAFTKHLKTADFFNAVRYPQMRFVSDRWNFDASGKVTSVDGKFTMLGKTHPVTLKAEKFNCYNSPMAKAQVCGGDFKATIDRTKWGLNTYVENMEKSRNVDLYIQVEAVRR